VGWGILVDVDRGYVDDHGKFQEFCNACFLCNTSDVAFGPLMNGYDEAIAFASWLEDDPRVYEHGKLEVLLDKFRKEKTSDKRSDSGQGEGDGDSGS
jgi:hypothetical protein